MTPQNIEDFERSAFMLDRKYNPEGDGEHPSYPRGEWRMRVYDGDTLSGYWDWVRHQLNKEMDELDRDSPYHTELPE